MERLFRDLAQTASLAAPSAGTRASPALRDDTRD
jgi:hypothetical protein